MSDRDRSGYDVEAIKAAHPLDVFLSARGVVLKRHGAVLQGKCPFHNEVNGTALTVWPDEGRWRCFGKCDAGGDVIEAVMRLDGVSFKEACARLGGTDRAAVNAPAPTSQPKPAAALTTEQAQAMMDAARALLQRPGTVAKIAAARGWQVATIIQLAKETALGWHDGKLAFLYEHGLKVRWKAGDGARHFAWIFGSNELWRAERIGPEVRRVFIAEGESDCISLVDTGLEADGGAAVVAVPGASAWRPEWGERLRGRDVILCTDADAAGDKAAQKIAAALAGVAARVARLSPRELFTQPAAA